MTTFKVEAMDTQGVEVKHLIKAKTEEEARRQARQKGLFVTKVRPLRRRQTKPDPPKEVVRQSWCARLFACFGHRRREVDFWRQACQRGLTIYPLAGMRWAVSKQITTVDNTTWSAAAIYDDSQTMFDKVWEYLERGTIPS